MAKKKRGLTVPLQPFSATENRLRKKWHGLVETRDGWDDLGPVPDAGESDAICVRNSKSGQLGVAKPGPKKAMEDFYFRAAHEKLAFDLAYLLELPVPPVVLWRVGAPDPYKCGRSISAQAFPQFRKWSSADERGYISTAQKEGASPVLSAMRVFHLWIGDLDRNLGQVLVDAEKDGALALAFVDHSNSMTHDWHDHDSDIMVQPPCAPELMRRDIMSETVDLIAKLPEAKIKHIVDRVPEPYLPDPQRRIILSNLLLRKEKLGRRLRLE